MPKGNCFTTNAKWFPLLALCLQHRSGQAALDWDRWEVRDR